MSHAEFRGFPYLASSIEWSGGRAVEAGTLKRTLVNDPDPTADDSFGPDSRFVAWLDRIPSVVVDGEHLWLVGGDQLRDRSQMADAWLRLSRTKATGRAHDDEGIESTQGF